MLRYEYRVLPAPRRGEKGPGLKKTPDRFAHALTRHLNEMAADGWEFVRAETLPCDERAGLTGTATHYHAVLVFRRPTPERRAQEIQKTEPAPRLSPPEMPGPRSAEGKPPPVLRPVEEGAPPPLGPAD